jgi:hypothetical protein
MRAHIGGIGMMKRMAAIAMAFAVVATSACGKDDKSPTGNNNTTVGTYSLDKVDGGALWRWGPCTARACQRRG